MGLECPTAVRPMSMIRFVFCSVFVKLMSVCQSDIILFVHYHITTYDGRKVLKHSAHQENREHRIDQLFGFSASDLLLIYFFDQNSDACVRRLTQGVADLVDTHVPGSQATSLYIRSVYNLIEPFSKP